MNRTYRDSGGTTAWTCTEEAARPIISAYRLLLDGSGVLTVFIDEGGSPLLVPLDSNVNLLDTTQFRELALAARVFGGDLILYDLDCTELVTSGLGIPYQGAPESDLAPTPLTPLFLDATVTRSASKAVLSDAA